MSRNIPSAQNNDNDALSTAQVVQDPKSLIEDYAMHARALTRGNRGRKIREAIKYFEDLYQNDSVIIDRKQLQTMIALGYYRTGNLDKLKKLNFDSDITKFISSTIRYKKEIKNYYLKRTLQHIGSGSVAAISSFLICRFALRN